jgi:hypothetical protein
MAILGDYDTALAEFKLIFGHVHEYSQKYNQGDTGSAITKEPRYGK